VQSQGIEPIAHGQQIEARSIAALNIRDHTSYLLAAYGIALVVLLLNLLGAMRSASEARKNIQRKIRQESNE
jgi:heme exporter protein CcmD